MDEFIAQIPPVNAGYLLASEPYHVYADAHGSVNEVLIQRVGGSVYGIIAEFFHDGSSRGGSSSASSALLTPDGYFLSPDNPDQRLSVEFEMYRRLLNPMNWSGWQHQRRYTKERRIPENYLRKTYPKTRGPISVHALVAEKVARIQARG